MQYCKQCILPDTRPGLVINEDGICNACVNAQSKRDEIDWAGRQQNFLSVVESAKSRSRGYDCLVPVSGGKDSTWQIVKCLEYGLNPLAVTWKTPARTDIGQRNLDNLVSLGVDHIDYQISPAVEKRFMLKALRRFGSTAIPMHLALFNIPLNIASRFNIPLIIWGENSAFEYGTEEEALTGFELNGNWLKKFGVSHATTAVDWIDDDLTEKELTPYFGPDDETLSHQGIKAVFLGYYFPWDPQESLRVAQANGFKVSEQGPRTGYYNYADIDDDFISIHHYLKWYKFGFTRTWDNLSLEIRNGRLTRQQAIEIIRERGDETPKADIQKFCGFAGISCESFFGIIEKFRNGDIWHKVNNQWVIKDFLIPDWQWTKGEADECFGNITPKVGNAFSY
ncbi:MAG: N-acetyl sugar amidotransferase [Candidatus Omnitrophota bacterium]